jgi:hypothetical protein
MTFNKHGLRLVLLPDVFAICKLGPDAPIPPWASLGDFWSMTRTAEELSLVCRQGSVPKEVRHEPGWRCVRVAGTMDFSMIGVVASLVTPLAEAEISVFVVSTFDTDYLLVRDRDWERAAAALHAAGHEIA